jgi:hypothetical protein
VKGCASSACRQQDPELAAMLRRLSLGSSCRRSLEEDKRAHIKAPQQLSPAAALAAFTSATATLPRPAEPQHAQHAQQEPVQSAPAGAAGAACAAEREHASWMAGAAARSSLSQAASPKGCELGEGFAAGASLASSEGARARQQGGPGMAGAGFGGGEGPCPEGDEDLGAMEPAAGAPGALPEGGAAAAQQPKQAQRAQRAQHEGGAPGTPRQLEEPGMTWQEAGEELERRLARGEAQVVVFEGEPVHRALLHRTLRKAGFEVGPDPGLQACIRR